MKQELLLNRRQKASQNFCCYFRVSENNIYNLLNAKINISIFCGEIWKIESIMIKARLKETRFLVRMGEGERERETDRQTDRQADRQTDRDKACVCVRMAVNV